MAATALGEVVDIVMGQAPPGNACNKDGVGTPFVKAGEFQDRRPAIREWTTKPLKMAQHDDTLVCVVGATAGKVNQGADCAIGRSVAAVRPRTDTIDPEFLYRFLSTTVTRLRGGSQGAAQGLITREMIGSLALQLPPLPDQRRIAAILDHADALRAKRREVLAHIDSLSQSIFNDKFGDVPATKPMSANVEEFRYGTSNKSGGAGYPALRVPNVIGGAIDTAEVKTVEVEPAELKRLTLRDGDLLFVRTNGNPDNVGRSAIFSEAAVKPAGFSDQPWIYASYLIRARFADGVEPRFVAAYLGGPEGRRQLRERSKTSAGQYNINTEALRSLRLPSASLTTQREFARRVGAIEERRKHILEAQVVDNELFAALQSRAFRGEL